MTAATTVARSLTMSWPDSSEHRIEFDTWSSADVERLLRCARIVPSLKGADGLSRIQRRHESPTFDAEVTSGALADNRPIAEIGHKHEAYPSQGAALSHFSCL